MAPPNTCTSEVWVDVHFDLFLRFRYVSVYLLLISSRDSEYFSFNAGSSLNEEIVGSLKTGWGFGKTGFSLTTGSSFTSTGLLSILFSSMIFGFSSAGALTTGD